MSAENKTINLMLAHNSDVLLKTDAASRSLIQDAKGLCEHCPELHRLEDSKGFDRDRIGADELWCRDGFRCHRVATPMKVGHVKERSVKNEPDADVWVPGTEEQRTRQALRELAHRRWERENNGFQQLESPDHHAFVAVRLRRFIGWHLVAWCRFAAARSDAYEGVKITAGVISERLTLSCFTDYAASS